MDYLKHKEFYDHNLALSLKEKLEEFTFGEEQEQCKSISIPLDGCIDEDWSATRAFDNEFERDYLRALKSIIGSESYCIKESDVVPVIQKINQYIDDLIVVSINPAIWFLKNYRNDGLIDGHKVLEFPSFDEKILPISLVVLKESDLPFIEKTPDGNPKIGIISPNDTYEVVPYIKIGHNINAKAIQIIIAEHSENDANSIEVIKNIWK